MSGQGRRLGALCLSGAFLLAACGGDSGDGAKTQEAEKPAAEGS
jgi:hypothetical protein